MELLDKTCWVLKKFAFKQNDMKKKALANLMLVDSLGVNSLLNQVRVCYLQHLLSHQVLKKELTKSQV